jgi:hypothetical protein
VGIPDGDAGSQKKKVLGNLKEPKFSKKSGSRGVRVLSLVV